MNGPALARQPNPLPNPFRPGNGVPPPYLAGRDPVVNAFEDWILEAPPLHANWALTGLRGTGKTVLLGEFATRAERAGWLTLQREVGDRHRDDARFAQAIVEDCEALIARADALAAVGQAVERGARWLRPKRIRVGEVSLDPAYEANLPAPADVMHQALAQLDSTLSHTERPGAIILYDEAHVVADDRGGMRRRGKGEGSISKRANGYFQASYTGSDGKRYYLQARTRQEATEKLQAALRDKALGVFVAGNSQTLATFLASWIRGSKGRLAPRTYERYSGQIRLNIVPYIGDVPIRKLTPQHLSDLYATLKLSPASIAHLHRVLRSALAEGMRWNLIARNPADAVRAPRAKPREVTILTPDEVRAFFAAAKGDEHECLYVLAVHTGLRQGELLGLRWRDVDLKAGWLEVSASLTRGGQRRPPKTSRSRRRVKLSDTAKRTLSAHRLRMAERLLLMQARAEGDTLVFVDPKGDPFNGAHITERALKPLLRREGLREIRFHDLRHAFASLMLSQGARVDLVSQMLGHSSAGLTLSIYAHLMPGDQESAVHRLDLLLAGA